MSLSDEHRQSLSAICARLVPADELGPGAVEAGAPTYIEQSLASAYSELLPLYEHGFELLDLRAQARCGAHFALIAESAQDELLRDLETQELDTDGRRFFEAVRNHTIEAMFGLPRWGGNRDQLGWKLIGYPEPRLLWSEPDQEIVELPVERPAATSAEADR